MPVRVRVDVHVHVRVTAMPKPPDWANTNLLALRSLGLHHVSF